MDSLHQLEKEVNVLTKLNEHIRNIDYAKKLRCY
jgi:hypothetical protein